MYLVSCIRYEFILNTEYRIQNTLSQRVDVSGFCRSFRARDDFLHYCDRFHRIFSPRRLIGEHNGVGSGNDCKCRACDLGPGRAGNLDPGLQHLCCDDDGLAGGSAFRDHFLF